MSLLDIGLRHINLCVSPCCCLFYSPNSISQKPTIVNCTCNEWASKFSFISTKDIEAWALCLDLGTVSVHLLGSLFKQLIFLIVPNLFGCMLLNWFFVAYFLRLFFIFIFFFYARVSAFRRQSIMFTYCSWDPQQL